MPDIKLENEELIPVIAAGLRAQGRIPEDEYVEVSIHMTGKQDRRVWAVVKLTGKKRDPLDALLG